MVISKQDAICEMIANGLSNDEIRDELDGRLSDKTINKLRANPLVGGKEATDEEVDAAMRAISPNEPNEPPEPAEKRGGAIRAIATAFEGQCMPYRADEDGIWLGKAGQMLFVPHDMIDVFMDELAFVRDAHEDMRNNGR